MKHFTRILYLMSACLLPLSGMAADYLPFIEQGKTFQYMRYKENIQTYGKASTKEHTYYYDEQPYTIKIEGTKTVDGQEWAVCMVYDGFSNNPREAQPFCLLREEANGDLYALLTDSDSEYTQSPFLWILEKGQSQLVHSLANPSQMMDTWEVDNAQFIQTTYTTPSGRTLHAIDIKGGYRDCLLVESLGMIAEYDAFFLGLIPRPTCFCADNLNLYQIKSTDGELLYENASMQPPMWWPTVHPGKTWRYTYLDSGSGYGEVVNRKWELHIQGSEQKNGVNYYTVYAYFDDSDTPEQGIPYAWMREDKDGNVYALANPDYKYAAFQQDMLNFYLEEALVQSYTDYEPRELMWTLEEPTSGEHVTPEGRHLRTLSDNASTLIEGIGYLSNYDLPATIFCCDYTTTLNPVGKTFLYEVEDYDGSILYYNKANAPTAGVSDITVDKDTTDVPAEYYDIHGRRIDNPSQGIYIRRQGSTVSKEIR